MNVLAITFFTLLSLPLACHAMNENSAQSALTSCETAINTQPTWTKHELQQKMFDYYKKSIESIATEQKGHGLHYLTNRQVMLVGQDPSLSTHLPQLEPLVTAFNQLSDRNPHHIWSVNHHMQELCYYALAHKEYASENSEKKQ